MGVKNYRIRLSVPLGERNGTMVLRETEGHVEGWLNVMNAENPFSGSLSDSGQLTLSGVLRTLVSTVRYTAAGIISGRNILLNLKTASGACYPVTGEEYYPDDKVLSKNR